MTKTPCAVIFDVDGVLVDSYEAHLRAWQMLAAETGRPFDEKRFAGEFGRRAVDVIRLFFDGDRLSGEQIAALHARKSDLYRELLAAEFEPIDGAAELVESLHQARFRLAAASSGLRANVELVIDRLGVGSLIEARVTAEDVERGKPDPQPFLLAAERLGLEPPRCAVIEDAPVGIAAAAAAGMASIGLARDRPAEELGAAWLVVRSLREVTPDIVRRLIDAQ